MSADRNQDVELKGGMYTFLSLKLHTIDPESVATALADKIQQAPGFFRNAPVVVDLSHIEDKQPDVEKLLETVREYKMNPIVASVQRKDSEFASSIDLPLVESGPRASELNQSGEHNDAAETADADATETDLKEQSDNDNSGQNNADARSLDPVDLAMAGAEIEYIVKTPTLVRRPVRSGQQVYARETDLIVLGSIGPGAEVIADNNIHVYGPLRGRALCGVSGNQEARIFCQSLEAELVSVAGNYKLLEEIPDELRGKPAQISYVDNRLLIEPL
jgi:septum site-determining protein MinC